MNKGELIALAERVEATAPAGQFRVITEAGMAVWGWHDPRFKRLLRLCEEGAFLDAAMTLVPEGWFTRLAAEDRHSHSWRWDLRGSYGIEAGSRASTPALALTAACLCARTALAPSDLASKSEERDDG